VTVAVARADTDEGHLGTDRVQKLPRDGLGAPVVANLDHVDIGQQAVSRQLLEDV